jgi:hypothetical protein
MEVQYRLYVGKEYCIRLKMVRYQHGIMRQTWYAIKEGKRQIILGNLNWSHSKWEIDIAKL